MLSEEGPAVLILNPTSSYPDHHPHSTWHQNSEMCQPILWLFSVLYIPKTLTNNS